MSWNGIDAVDKAVSRTKRALFEPFDFWKWIKLAIIILGSSLFLMDKMLFQFTRIGFCDDIHTKQRRALFYS
jgi:hypothetical protein